jgi:hypothetical protein
MPCGKPPAFVTLDSVTDQAHNKPLMVRELICGTAVEASERAGHWPAATRKKLFGSLLVYFNEPTLGSKAPMERTSGSDGGLRRA